MYIGQTSRALKARTKEHKKSRHNGTTLCTKQSRIYLDDALMSDRNSINEHIQLPDIYTILANP